MENLALENVSHLSFIQEPRAQNKACITRVRIQEGIHDSESKENLRGRRLKFGKEMKKERERMVNDKRENDGIPKN